MNRRNLPFNALRAFETAARTLSFSKAADELCVTHSAVSHQIKKLEETLGSALFLRSNRGVRLTEAGETLLPVLVDAFDRMADTLEGLVQKPEPRALRVTTTPTFASKWLVSHLWNWRARHGETEIHLLPSLRYFDFSAREADIGIRCGLPPWLGLKAEFLLPIHMTPLCSPAFLAAAPPLRRPRDLLRCTLIHADTGRHDLSEEWRTWFTAAGVADFGALPGPSFHDPSLALQAALDGQGLAIGYLELAATDLAAGRLVQPIDFAVRHSFSYFLVYAASRAQDPKIAAFRDWIRDEIGAGKDLSALAPQSRRA